MDSIFFDTPEQQRDKIAREAARLLQSGQAADVRDALRRAIAHLGWQHRDDLSLPSLKRIRDHCRGIAMQALGAEGYQQSIVAVWRTAEELMTLLSEHGVTTLIGRAVRGQIDAGVTVRIRIYTNMKIGELADLLVDYGYPDPAIVTADTKFGRFDRLEFDDDDTGLLVQITRCPPSVRSQVEGRNLFTRDPLDAVADLDAIRRLIESHTP